MPIFYLVAEWIAFITSLLLFFKNTGKFYKWFILYCATVLIVEHSGRWIILSLHLATNHVLYNFAILFFVSFYFFSLHHFLYSSQNKRIVIICGSLFISFWLINIIFIQGYNRFDSYSFIIGYTLLAICCVLYYIEMMKKNSIILFNKESAFFIVSGYFIYSFLNALILTLHEYFAYFDTPVTVVYRKAFNTITDISNVALYLLLSIAFIIKWTSRKL